MHCKQKRNKNVLVPRRGLGPLPISLKNTIFANMNKCKKFSDFNFFYFLLD